MRLSAHWTRFCNSLENEGRSSKLPNQFFRSNCTGSTLDGSQLTLEFQSQLWWSNFQRTRQGWNQSGHSQLKRSTQLKRSSVGLPFAANTSANQSLTSGSFGSTKSNWIHLGDWHQSSRHWRRFRSHLQGPNQPRTFSCSTRTPDFWCIAASKCFFPC